MSLRRMLSKNSGMGLLNMKERAAYVGGTVSVHSSPKGGMEISVQLPIEPAH